MASRSAAVSLVRRTSAVRTYHASTKALGGMSPPVPPFAQNPAKFAPLTENTDAVWDDGVAPELALDFDAPNISSSEALYTWAGTFFGFYMLYQGISWWTSGAQDDNPALAHALDNVVPDYSDHTKAPLE